MRAKQRCLRCVAPSLAMFLWLQKGWMATNYDHHPLWRQVTAPVRCSTTREPPKKSSRASSFISPTPPGCQQCFRTSHCATEWCVNPHRSGGCPVWCPGLIWVPLGDAASL